MNVTDWYDWTIKHPEVERGVVCASLWPQWWKLQVFCDGMGGPSGLQHVFSERTKCNMLISHARNIDHTWILLFFCGAMLFLFFSDSRTTEWPLRMHLQDVAHTYGEHAHFGRLDVSKAELKAHRLIKSIYLVSKRGCPLENWKNRGQVFCTRGSDSFDASMKINALSGTHCQGMIGNKAFLNCHLCKPDWSHWSSCNNVSVGSSN